jgi:hypothetical protein
MARIRTIKPEFFEDGKIARLSLRARLLFIGIWNYCDDVGACRADGTFLSSRVFPYDSLTTPVVLQCLSELQKQGLILIAEHKGETYLLVKNFKKHQRIDKPSKMRNVLDSYEENLEYFTEHSMSTPGVVEEYSPGELGTRNEELGTRSEERGAPPGGALVPAAPPKKTEKVDGREMQEAIATYCREWKRLYNSQAIIGDKERAVIRRLIKSYGITQTLVLINAYTRMPDHWFATKTHDLPTLEGNVPKVKVFVDSGKMMSRKEAQQLDLKVANHNTIAALEKGEI